MDEFKRMMEMEGVRPIGAKRSAETGRRSTPNAGRDPGTAPAAPSSPSPSTRHGAGRAPVHAWVSGPAARTALEVALQRVHDGDGSEWATAIVEGGEAKPLPALQGAPRLLAAADRLGAQLVVIGGKGWSFVLHPGMGIATLDAAPDES